MSSSASNIDLPGLYKKAFALYDLPQGRTKHFTFILRRNKVISFGWNKGFKTSVYAARLKYKYPYLHSEIDALKNFPWPNRELSKCKLVNLRIGGDKRELMISRPCEYCEPVLRYMEIGEIYYTDSAGKLVAMSGMNG